MKKILTILYLGISLLSIAQQNNENLLKHTPTETVAYDYFLEQILHKEYPKMKHFVFYEKIKTEKIFNYSVCNPIDNSKMIFSAPYDFTDKKSPFPSQLLTNKTAEIYCTELTSENNYIPVIVCLKNNNTKLFFTIVVDTTKKEVIKHCSTTIQTPKLTKDESYEKTASNQRNTNRISGIYNNLRDKEPTIKGNSIIMVPKKLKGETFYFCENCSQLFGKDYEKKGAISDGENFYYRYSEDFFLKKYYSKVEFIGDYMYFLTFSQSYDGYGGSNLSIQENIAKYVNYDGVNVKEFLNKELLEKIIYDDNELLKKFQNDSKRNKKLKQYLIEYYDRKKNN